MHVAAHGEELKLLWETSGFKNPESVVHDPRYDVLYVSNVNGDATAKTEDGFISRVSLDGEILELEWVTGLHAPKGMAIHGERLYVADIDALVEIDVTTANIVERYIVDDAQFLNDVAVGEDGRVYVSDMALDRIHRLKDGKFTIWLESGKLENPNGLYVEANRIVVAAWGVMTDGFATDTPGHLKAVSLSDKSVTSIGPGEPVGNLDGVERDIDGDYYVTDWVAGKLYHIGPDGSVELLLELSQGSADLGHVPEKNLLLIPMMLDNKLLAYSIRPEM
jgi:sugar lactone lactonase YvrE